MRVIGTLIGVCFVILSFSQDKKPTTSFNDALTRLKNSDDLENYTYTFIDQYLTNATKKHLSLFDLYEKMIWRAPKSPNEQLAYVILLCNKGYYLNHFGNTYKSIEAYEKAWKIYEEHALQGFDIIEYCMIPLGNNYTITGDYTNAANIVKHYLFQSEQGKNKDHTLSAFINLSIIYHSIGKYNDAINVLQQASSIKNTSPDKKALIYANLATNYAGLNDLTDAKRNARLAIIQLRREISSAVLLNIYTLLSTISIKENNIASATDFIQKAEAIAMQSPTQFKPRDRAKLANNAAFLLQLNKDYEAARKAYHRAFAILLPTYKGNGLPDTTMLYAENTIKETLDGLAEVYINLNQGEMALRCYDLAYVVEDLLRETYNYDDARLLQQLENRNRTERAIDVLYTRASITKNSSDIVRAFILAEQTKAITLQQNTKAHYAQAYIDHGLLKRERDLRYRQATLATEIIVEQLKHQQANVARIHDLIEEQNGIIIKLRDVKRLIKQGYPDYETKKAFKFEDLKATQKKLIHDNASLIEYFFGTNSLYIFTLSGKNITLQKLDSVQTLKDNILQLHDLFSEPSAINNNIKPYKALAFKISSSLHVASIVNKNLIIVPDGLLHVIPFDALLYKEVNGNDYATFPFLLNKHILSYQASADLYLNQTTETLPSENNILAMFPVFKNTNQELAYSIKEANGIHTNIDGTYLYEMNATRRSFLKNVTHFNIIHLSTHASAGDGAEPPSISFIDSTLYLTQIYGMHINADLVVLSACETGRGVLIKGEGAMSVARGFQFAGVNNIIFSLWKVNDYSTATLMTNFYANYASTGIKADALHHAKLDYLSDIEISNSRKSPYYWAGFIYYGSIDKQARKTDIDVYWYYLGTVMFITLSLLVMYWRKKRTHNRQRT